MQNMRDVRNFAGRIGFFGFLIGLCRADYQLMIRAAHVALCQRCCQPEMAYVLNVGF